MRKLVVALGVVLMLAASCGGKPTQSSTPAPTITKANVTDIAFKLGCSYEGDNEGTQWMASESGTCGDYGVATFSNSDAQNNWYQIARQAGGYYLVGNLWTVWSDTEPQISEAKSKLGGDIKS